MATEVTRRFRYDVFLSYKHEDGGDAGALLGVVAVPNPMSEPRRR